MQIGVWAQGIPVGKTALWEWHGAPVSFGVSDSPLRSGVNELRTIIPIRQRDQIPHPAEKSGSHESRPKTCLSFYTQTIWALVWESVQATVSLLTNAGTNNTVLQTDCREDQSRL